MLKIDVIENYSNMSIRKLPEEIKKNGFSYRLVKRNNERLIYAQHNALGKVSAYEVFFNKLGNNHKAKERWCKLQNKPFNPDDYEEWYEVFPSDEDFGKRAWTYSSLILAEKAFAEK